MGVDQKKSFEHEARSSPPAPRLHRPPRGLHCCRRHWVWRLSKELLLHMSSCKLCLHDHLHLHPCHHWHLLFGFPNNNEDVQNATEEQRQHPRQSPPSQRPSPLSLDEIPVTFYQCRF